MYRNPCNTATVMLVKLFFAVLVLLWAATATFAKENTAGWTPPPPTEMPTEFDWVQLPSGEWLGGEIIVLYEDSLEFDSNEMGITKIDWEDVVELRSVQILEVRSTEGESATGQVLIKDGKVQLIGDETVVFEQSEIITITAGVPKEINFWSGELSVSANFQSDTHRMETGAAYDIIGDLDLRVTWVWDYIAEPSKDENGIKPDKSDTQLLFGVGFSF